MRWLSLSLLLILLSGCAHYQSGGKNPLIRSSYDAADQLLNLTTPPLSTEAPLMVATFVNIDRLTEASTLGRVMSEQLASRLTQRGFAIVELKLRNNVYVREGKGEMMLSREVKDISTAHSVQAVVVGSYAVTPDKIFLNLKLVRPTDNRVISAHNIALDLDETTQSLLLSD